MHKTPYREYKKLIELKELHKTNDLDEMIDEKKSEIIKLNKGYVYKLAVPFGSGTNNTEDYVQAGYIGLLEALNRYDVEKGVKFLSFAHFYIIKEMQTLSRESRGQFVTPEHVHEIINSYSKQSHEPLEKFVESRDRNSGCNIKNTTTAIKRYLEMECGNSFEVASEDNKFCGLWRDLNKCLGDRELKVLKLRLQGYPAREICLYLGICEQRVSQIYKRAIKKLKNNEEFCKIWEGVV